jgi:hypothetical protein
MKRLTIFTHGEGELGDGGLGSEGDGLGHFGVVWMSVVRVVEERMLNPLLCVGPYIPFEPGATDFTSQGLT